MKNSRTSLNKPFYDWIKEVREADKKIEELEDKLYYYNVKLIGYNSPNFEPRLSSTKLEYKDNRYIWIDKITNTSNKIYSFKKIKNQYKDFHTLLNKELKEVLDTYLNSFNIKKYKSRSNYYQKLNKIALIFSKYM